MLLIRFLAQAMTMSCLDDRHLQKPQGWWVSKIRILPNVNIGSMFPRCWNRSRVPVENDFIIEETIVKVSFKGDGDRTPSWDLQEYWNRNSPLFKNLHYSLYLWLFFRRLSHGFSPSGLSHEHPLIKQLAWPCLYSSIFFKRPEIIEYNKFKSQHLALIGGPVWVHSIHHEVD